MVTRGTLICVEGIDHSGKSTQAALLAETLVSSGMRASVVRFPDRGTPTGSLIDAYLRGAAHTEDHVIHLLYSANRWEKDSDLRARLASGETLVLDRYSFSGVAYTAAKSVPGLDCAWCSAPETGLPRPDVVVYLDISPEDALARHAGDPRELERYEELGFLGRVAEAYQKEIAPRMGRESWKVVQAKRDRQEVARDVLEVASEALRAVQESGAPLGSLW